jgi:hypothetical protein
MQIKGDEMENFMPNQVIEDDLFGSFINDENIASSSTSQTTPSLADSRAKAAGVNTYFLLDSKNFYSKSPNSSTHQFSKVILIYSGRIQ